MKILLTFVGAASGLSPLYSIIKADKTVVQEPTNEGVTELVAGSGVYGVSVDYHQIAGNGTVVIWQPSAGALGGVEGPWDRWDSQ